MPRFDLYSKRQRDLAMAGKSDVYRYDIVTPQLRRQLLNIALEVFGSDLVRDRVRGYISNHNWVWIDATFSHEKGIDRLGGTDSKPAVIKSAYLNADFEDALDLTELIAVRINAYDEALAADHENYRRSGQPVKFINEVNYRLREAGMGFQFENGLLVRVDSHFLHGEAVKPALTLLSNPGFEGPQQEFLQAHASYRAGNNKEAVSMAAKALESTFKSIFDAKGWDYKGGARISDLIKVAKTNILWPEYLDNSFDQLVATLHSGLPQIRDKDAAHGQGAVPREVQDYLTAYALHLSASKIVFLVSAAESRS